MAKKGELTFKQQKFVREYCIDTNASKAARRAGYSPKTAFRSGQENMQKPAIKAKIAASLDNTFQKLEITQERILQEEAHIAYVDIRTLVNANDGTPLPLQELPERVARALSGLEIQEYVNRDGEVTDRKYKYKFFDKGAALFRLEKTQGLIIDKIQIDLTATLELVARIIGEECEPEQIERISGRMSDIAVLSVQN